MKEIELVPTDLDAALTCVACGGLEDNQCKSGYPTCICLKKMNKYEEALYIWNEETAISAKECEAAWKKGPQYHMEWWGNKSFEAGYNAALASAQEEIKELKASLAFYGEKRNWYGDNEYKNAIFHTDMDFVDETALDKFGEDRNVQYGGKLARQVLKGYVHEWSNPCAGMDSELEDRMKAGETYEEIMKDVDDAMNELQYPNKEE